MSRLEHSKLPQHAKISLGGSFGHFDLAVFANHPATIIGAESFVYDENGMGKGIHLQTDRKLVYVGRLEGSFKNDTSGRFIEGVFTLHDHLKQKKTREGFYVLAQIHYFEGIEPHNKPIVLFLDKNGPAFYVYFSENSESTRRHFKNIALNTTTETLEVSHG